MIQTTMLGELSWKSVPSEDIIIPDIPTVSFCDNPSQTQESALLSTGLDACSYFGLRRDFRQIPWKSFQWNFQSKWRRLELGALLGPPSFGLFRPCLERIVTADTGAFDGKTHLVPPTYFSAGGAKVCFPSLLEESAPSP